MKMTKSLKKAAAALVLVAIAHPTISSAASLNCGGANWINYSKGQTAYGSPTIAVSHAGGGAIYVQIDEAGGSYQNTVLQPNQSRTFSFRSSTPPNYISCKRY